MKNSYGSKLLTRAAPIALLAIGIAACTSAGSPGTQVEIERNAQHDAEIARYSALQAENPEDLTTLIHLSRNLRYAGRGEDAVAALQSAEDLFGSRKEYLTELGKAYLFARDL